MKYDHFTLSDLKLRGWTDSMVVKILALPDKRLTNPTRKRGPEMRLYLATRVLEAEATSDFAELRAKAERRSSAGKLTAAGRHQALLAEIKDMRIDVPVFERSQMERLAIRSYDVLWSDRGDYEKSAHGAEGEFLERICVNFLRHECSRYESELDQVFGKVGVQDAQVLIRRKVYDAIADAYPYLVQECKRQCGRRNDSEKMSRLFLDGNKKSALERIASIEAQARAMVQPIPS